MNLTQLALKHGSDKAGHHEYTPIYERYFERMRYVPVALLELGIGGYEFPDRGGQSLQMWNEYFPLGTIWGIDKHPKNGLDKGRIRTFVCSQDDHMTLSKIMNTLNPDIIIDDASHVSPLTIRSFEILFPQLKNGGTYAIEDTHTSYWPDHGYQGSPSIEDLNISTTVNYFKLLTDSMNHEHIAGYVIQPWMRDIFSIHFYEKMIFILKK